jgi:hypothetical protein
VKTNACPLGIKKASHFRPDGSCLCYEAGSLDQKLEYRKKGEFIDKARKTARERKGGAI